MKRVAIAVSVLAFLALAIYLALGSQNNTPAQPAARPSVSPVVQLQPTSNPLVTRNDQVAAACKLVPIKNVSLSFNTTGLVSDVLVTEVQTVGRGDLLAQLSNREQANAAVATAELDLINAQLELKNLYDSAPLKAAEALKALADAPEAVQEAEGKFGGLQSPTFNQADVDAAEANMIFAKNKFEKAQEAYRPFQNKNEDNLTRAKLLSDLSQAQKEYEAAVRKYNSFFGSPSETTITQAEADLALARIRQEEAQRTYEILKNGPYPDDVALAQARIANAEAQLAAAQASLSNLELRAPFTGTVANVNLSTGEYVAPGVNVMLLVDVSEWRIETTDLTELNVVRIRVGDPVEIVFDALQDRKFGGQVLSIGALGENRQGDITYRILTDIDALDERLRWNMTCSVVIQTQ
ncbi:MAG: efflux RND transporter periplasmic adaptor subunit [Anaerolineales bacterium]|nr:efflux RND transporter periplasmic adaptor subunit [Anaerolineales bacterium]